jgi:ABC-type lipoprotein release transport system permease subunit
MLRPALAYGVVSALRRRRGLVLPGLTVATGSLLLVLVMGVMPAVRLQGAAFGDAAGVGRAAVAIAGLVVLVGALEVAIVATRSITQRTREIGVLCSFGVRPLSVVCGLIVEPVLTAALGSAVGAVVGAVAAWASSAAGWAQAGVAGQPLAFAVGTSLLVSTVAATAASATPAVRAAHRPPLSALTT